jgi:hypothetical protein
VDALGNAVGFFLTGGQVHDLVGADHLLPEMEAETLITDKAFDADARVIEPRRRWEEDRDPPENQSEIPTTV